MQKAATGRRLMRGKAAFYHATNYNFGERRQVEGSRPQGGGSFFQRVTHNAS